MIFLLHVADSIKNGQRADLWTNRKWQRDSLRSIAAHDRIGWDNCSPPWPSNSGIAETNGWANAQTLFKKCLVPPLNCPLLSKRAVERDQLNLFSTNNMGFLDLKLFLPKYLGLWLHFPPSCASNLFLRGDRTVSLSRLKFLIHRKSSSKNKDLEATKIESLKSMTEKYPAVYKRYEETTIFLPL